MDRRDFLKTTGSAAATAGAVASVTSVQAQDNSQTGQKLPTSPNLARLGVRDLSFAMTAPDNGRGVGDSSRRLARRIESLTGGRFRLHVVTGAAAADAGLRHGSANDDVNANPAFAYFAGLPGPHGLAANDLDAWIAIGGGQMLWDDLAAAHGFKPFLAGHTGANPAIWSRYPLTQTSAFQGLKFAAHGLANDVARGLGAVPVAVAAEELALALTDGRLDASEGPGAMHSLAEGLAEAAPFALSEGINRAGTAQSLSVKSTLWQSLSAADQAAIAAAAAEEFRLSHAEARAHEALAWTVMRDRYKVAVSPAPAELADAIDRMSGAVVAHVAGANRIAQRINASFMAFRAMLPGPSIIS